MSSCKLWAYHKYINADQLLRLKSYRIVSDSSFSRNRKWWNGEPDSNLRQWLVIQDYNVIIINLNKRMLQGNICFICHNIIHFRSAIVWCNFTWLLLNLCSTDKTAIYRRIGKIYFLWRGNFLWWIKRRGCKPRVNMYELLRFAKQQFSDNLIGRPKLIKSHHCVINKKVSTTQH